MNVQHYLKLVPAVKQSPTGYLSCSYDAEADTSGGIQRPGKA